MPTSPQRNTVPWGNYSSSISSGSSWSQPIPSRAASVLAPITKSNSAPWGSYSSSVSSGRSWWVWRESDKVVTAFIQASDHSVLANQNQSILLGATQDGRIDLRSLCMNTQSLFGANIYYGDPSKNGAPCDTNPQSSSFKKSDPDQQKLLTLFYFDSNAQQTDQIGTILKVSPAKALEKFRTVYSRIPPGGTTSPRNDYLGATSAFTLSQIGDDQGRTPAFGRSDDNNIYFGGYMTTASITHEFGHQFDRYFKDTASMNAPRMGDSLNGFARKTTYNPVTKQWVPDNTEKENFADAYMTDILSGKGYLAPNGDNKEVLWNTTTNRIASFEAYIADLLKRSP